VSGSTAVTDPSLARFSSASELMRHSPALLELVRTTLTRKVSRGSTARLLAADNTLVRHPDGGLVASPIQHAVHQTMLLEMHKRAAMSYVVEVRDEYVVADQDNPDDETLISLAVEKIRALRS
jgi:hypothetical protein